MTRIEVVGRCSFRVDGASERYRVTYGRWGFVDFGVSGGREEVMVEDIEKKHGGTERRQR